MELVFGGLLLLMMEVRKLTVTHDEAAGTLTLSGRGAHVGLPKAVNGQELASSASAQILLRTIF